MDKDTKKLVARVEALESALGRIRIGGGNIDPPPDGGGWGGPWVPPGGWRGPILPPVWDPVPEDLGKLSRVQIESRLADIDLTRTKLDMLEGMLKEYM